MNQDSEHFKLFAECVPVRGAKRSVIYDLPRNSYKLIPNALFDIITQDEGRTINDIKSDYEPDDQGIIDEYFNMLQEGEYIFFCDKDELELFPKLPDTWDFPALISNAIIELPMERSLLAKTLAALEAVGCGNIQLRSFEELSFDDLDHIFGLVKKSDIDHIEIISKAPATVDLERTQQIFGANARLRTWTLHSAKQTLLKKMQENSRQNLVYTTEVKQQHRDFEQNGPNYFNVNIDLFFESRHYNNYYNRKACITSTGEVKNCLSLDKSFGNIANSDLKDIGSQPGFQELWHITNDKIESCKHCEFRYMCVENSPLVFEGDKIYRSKECFYNPQAAAFKNES